MIRPLSFFAGAVLAGGAVTGWLWWSGGPVAATPTPAPITETAPLVRVATVEARPAARALRLTGTLVARAEVAVSAEVMGLRITELAADIGDRVQRGQVLARLDTAVLRAQLAHSDAQLERARAAIAQGEAQIREAAALAREAEATFRRADQIRASGAVSVEQLDQRRAQAAAATARVTAAEQGVRLARAERDAAQAQRDELSVRLAQSDLVAPADGIVLARSARLGQQTTNEPLFMLLQDGLVELEGELGEADLAEVVAGMVVRVEPATGTAVMGTVRLVAPMVDAVTRQGRVRIALPLTPALKPGMFARGTIELPAIAMQLVPEAALRFDGPTSFVYRVVDDRVERVPVITGLRRAGLVEVRSALSGGETIVLGAGAFLRAGDRVRQAEP